MLKVYVNSSVSNEHHNSLQSFFYVFRYNCASNGHLSEANGCEIQHKEVLSREQRRVDVAVKGALANIEVSDGGTSVICM